jgi:putative oxidoreductase
MSSVRSTSTTMQALQSILILLLRLFWGYQFAAAGLSKLQDPVRVMNAFTDLGIPFPHFNAYFVAIVECIGGLCLLFGFLSRFAALLLSITMVVAYATAHVESVRNLFTSPSEFILEAPFPYLFTSLVVLCFGPGLFSVDAWLNIDGKSKAVPRD